jgi:hypothetical protein
MIRLTRAAAKELGITVASPARPRPDDGMNGLERAFRDELLEPSRRAATIAAWWREPVKLRLAGRTWYTPDFAVRLLDGSIVLIETKGFMREDACIKLKVAASAYPCFGWYVCYRDRGCVWRIYRVTATGIGRRTCPLPWGQGG